MALWDSILTSAIVFICISILYKKSVAYDVVEGVIVGASTSVAFTQAISSLLSTTLEPLGAGDWTMILPLIYGAAFFTILSTRHVGWYRAAFGVRMSAELGIAVASFLMAAWGQISGYTLLVQGFNDFIIIVGMICSFSYLLFGQKTSNSLRWVGRVGLYFVFLSMAALNIDMFYRYMNTMIPQISDAVTTTEGIIIGVVILAVILIDAVVDLGKYFRKEVEAVT